MTILYYTDILACSLDMSSKIHSKISAVPQVNCICNVSAVAQRGVLFDLVLEPIWTRW